ncbi:hypothetical protein GCM10010182_10710 [Actinomadura cremea]|nr:hypothetical protein GCM10010182_10710 [Actinomadura cremea]
MTRLASPNPPDIDQNLPFLLVGAGQRTIEVLMPALHRAMPTARVAAIYRAHPLGLAMAEVYLQRLDGWLFARQHHAARLENLLAGRTGINASDPPAGLSQYGQQAGKARTFEQCFPQHWSSRR